MTKIEMYYHNIDHFSFSFWHCISFLFSQFPLPVFLRNNSLTICHFLLIEIITPPFHSFVNNTFWKVCYSPTPLMNNIKFTGVLEEFRRNFFLEKFLFSDNRFWFELWKHYWKSENQIIDSTQLVSESTRSIDNWWYCCIIRNSSIE